MRSGIKKPASDLRRRLEKASRLGGAEAFGVASVKSADALPRIWIDWTVNRHTVKLASVLPGARSIVVFGVPSTDDSDELETDRGNGVFTYPGYMSIRVIYRDMMRLLASEGYRATLPREDTSTTSYKCIASLAGIGSFGKSSLILSPKHGPWLRIGLLLTDAPLTPDKPFTKDMCGECTKCIRACPTGALTPYKVDPDKCLVGATSMPRSSKKTATLLDTYEPKITSTTRVMCRACQMVCPCTPAERRKHIALIGRP